MEQLEFKCDSLSYGEIENRITLFYGLGYTNSSDFMELELGIHTYNIVATKGNIEFSAIVGKDIKGNGYIVTIIPKKVKNKN